MTMAAKFRWNWNWPMNRDFPHQGHIESLDNHLNPDTGSILLRAVFQ